MDDDTFDCTNVGPNAVILTITDDSGNTHSATAVVTVEDTVAPVAIAQNITVQLDATGNVTITAADVDNGSSDNCNFTLYLDDDTFDCTNVGPNNVILTITDDSGNTDTATAVVTVEDIIDPVAVAKNITIQLDASGQAIITAADIDDGSSDNCGFTLSLNKTTFDCENVGPNTVVFVIEDTSGNMVQEVATVTVVDDLTPNVVTQDITVYLDATGNVTITESQINDGSTDNCEIDSMTLDITAFDCSKIGDNTVELTVEDVNGNTATATAIVTVADDIAPNAAAQNITVYLDATGNVTITASQIDNDSTDNCDIATMTLDITAFDCTKIGDNTVELTVEDVNGNTATATAIITVVDDLAPTAVTQNITVYLDATGNAIITAAQIDNNSTDNCDIDTMTLDITAFDCTKIGDNTVGLTVEDVNGNTATATAIVTVVDNLAPNVVTQNITVYLDETGNATITAAQIDNGSTDNCDIDTMTLNITTFDCTKIGDNTVELTVEDVNGNTATATAIITVVDDLVPNVVTQDITVYLDATGNATITTADVDNGSTDNCGIDTMVLDIIAFDCTNVGDNIVELTVTDVNGNSASATATVTVFDDELPVAVAQNIAINLDAVTGLATITPDMIDNGSTDNCSFVLSLDITDFTCEDIGPNPVQLIVTDAGGNVVTADAVVTVSDISLPVAIAQPFTIPLNSNGVILLVPSEVDGGSYDNCDIVSRVVTPSLFSCSDLGDHTVTLTVTDASGNTASATTVVTVIDNINPVAVAQNITVQLDANGSVTITPQQVDNGSFDICGITSMTLDNTEFDCSDIGNHNVILTVTDAGGNTNSATAIVTVEDATGPVIASQATTLALNANGTATLVLADVDTGTTDNCGIQSIVLSKTDFNCSNLGDNTVVITATDVNDNVSKQSVVVTIVDNLAPTAIAQDIEISLNPNGFVTITPEMINNGSSDNCAIDSMSLDITSFTCTDIGPNTVVLTVKDKAGNTATDTAVVTILPLPLPTLPSLSQTFCAIDEPTIGDIAIDDVLVEWYADATSSKRLSSSTSLVTGTYYVATRYGNCYSTRVAVNIILKDLPAPTGETIQYVCVEKESTIADLITNEVDVVWYETSTGGVPLSASTVLEDKQRYYASYVGEECESTKRLEVEVIVRYCDVVIHNAVSANGDGINDYFSIKGVESFPDNKLEIFNRWGSTVFEASHYGQEGNFFKGFANTGLGTSNGGLLPYGTYYYVFSFTNHDGNRITKTGFLHLNH
ncbi:hypothetical protein D3C87_440730 [compost metagenome]